MSLLLFFIIFETIEQVFTLVFRDWLIQKVFKNNKRQYKFVVTAFMFTIITGFLLSGFYSVKSNETVVLTTLTGNKKIVEQGLHYRLQGVSSIERIDMRKVYYTYPTFKDINMFDTWKTISTKDEQVIEFIGIVNYQVKDAHVWGIQNLDSSNKMYFMIESEITETMRSKTKKQLFENRVEIEQEIYDKIKSIEPQFGVEILSFRIRDMKETEPVINAKFTAESRRIQGDSLIEYSEKEKEANQIKISGLEDAQPFMLDYLRAKDLYEIMKDMPNDKVIVIPDGDNVNYQVS